jgi:nucleoside-diphosphate-sugar epimerase
VRTPVIILGVTGFVGGELARLFRERGQWHTVGLSSRDCNLLDFEQTAQVLSTQPAPAHWIMCSSILLLPGEPSSIFADNVAMARNVARSLASLPMSSFTYFSSVDVYGRPPSQSPLSEHSPVNPTGYYGLSKYASERLLQFALRCPVTVLRCPGMYGPGDHGRSIVGQFVSKVRARGVIELAAGGLSLRDYVHSDDVFEVVSALLSRGDLKSRILNLATGRSLPLRDVVELISGAVGHPAQVRTVSPQSLSYDLVFDNRTLTQLLPAIRFKALEDGIRDYCRGPSTKPPSTD